MNRFHTPGRLTVILAGLTGALVAFWAGPASAAFAAVVAPLGGDPHRYHGLITGHPGLTHAHPGPAGSPTALIAAGAALLAAALAVLVYRMRAARQRVTVNAA